MPWAIKNIIRDCDERKTPSKEVLAEIINAYSDLDSKL